MTPEKATSVLSSDGVTLDDLLIRYGEIKGEINAAFISQALLNREYLGGDAVQGGTIRVKRLAMASSQAYGTARAAKAGNALQNNGVDVKIDTDKEIAEELSGKDKALYFERGGLAVLDSRRSSFATAMGITLEEAYFTALQNAAVANGLVDVSTPTAVEDKLLLLIRTLEAKTGDNVNKVPRELMVLTLSPEWYDELEQYMVTLNSPDGNSRRMLHRVQVEPAVRQGFDAIVQVKGSIAQPLVMSEDFEVGKWQGSADYYAYMPYFFGTKAVMPELILAAALDDDISA